MQLGGWTTRWGASTCCEVCRPWESLLTEVEGVPTFKVQFDTTNGPVKVVCSLEQMQDLVATLQDAVHESARLSQ